ncbi:hypothetical protein F4778DRAFT_753931 [Xylariomycetidae sp. FL2044]|nr:hypothetical protein F4778DRAFT_753931 [Xylariomycetidae sp. FL2044]
MPSNLPSSFASAAAGQNTSRDPRSGARNDGRGNNSGDWSRQGRSTNGTLTFRRTSTTPSQPNPLQGIESSSIDPAVITAMPVGSTAVDASAPRRYSREQLLSIFDSQQHSDSLPDVSSLFMPGWNPGHANGAGSRGWGMSTDSHVVPQDPDICWDSSGSTKPMGLQDLTSEERELFTSDINSTMKPPQPKDGNHAGGGLNGRKTSLSQGTSNAFGLASPSTASRPGARRRETADTNPYSPNHLASPTSATRQSRDDPSYWFGRRGAEPTSEEPEEMETAGREPTSKPLPFGGLMRNNTTGSSAGLNSSPWQPASSATTSGMGAFGSFALPGSAIGEKRPGNTRGESRLAHLIPKESSDKLSDSIADPGRSWRPRQRTDTDPFGDDGVSGSAVLGGAQDTSPPPMSHAALHASTYDTPVKGSAADFGMSNLHIGSQPDHEHTPLSPTETNPYRSPAGDRGEQDDTLEKHTLGGFPRSLAQAAFEGSDRSQTSSVGAKPFPLNNLTGWPSSGTPDRERAPFPGFGGSLFGPVGDLQSPSLNLGGVFAPAQTTGFGGGGGSLSRGSKLGSLFPPAMQAQMANQENDSLADSIPDLRQSNPLGAIGRNTFDPMRETESPMRAGRGVFAELFSQSEQGRTPVSEALHGHVQNAVTSGAPSYTSNQSAEPPAAQARQMVMPDRMRWVYLDPQGHQQGPFTGLEMNDWYKANFFTPDLRVKKLEDAEFEPLGQLIRRIGNSREPFLVPQIGILHGQPSQAGPFSPNASGVIQPPLVGAFPSFGRTLTAEEQNNLERRKQEEQFYMARQREILANQQTIGRVPMSGVPGLHHHSSAHSLQSQPSFGSITSPITMPPQAPIGAIGTAGSFFDPAAVTNAGPGLDLFREDELARLSGPERQILAGLHGNQPPQPIGGPSSDMGVRGHLPGSSELADDGEGFRGRLQQFEQLRAHEDAAETQGNELEKQPEAQSSVAESNEPGSSQRNRREDTAALTKEYQQAQAAEVAAKLRGLPMPFPPPQSTTPLPAPAPQRVRSNLPEQYASSTRSGTPEMTPSSAATQPPPLAPWAKDTGTESHKGPSLKEIQQAEAIKAAKAEESAVVARRALVEQEAARERERVAATGPGLPTSSTWGTASPVSAGPSSIPWTKPSAAKGPAPGLSAPGHSSDKKKTLADIQREEEARKQKAKELAVQTGGLSSNGGKRYADLASKPNAVPLAGQAMSAGAVPPSTAGWATVGAGGKVKPPIGPSSQGRSVSATNVKAAPPVAPSPRPTVKTSNSTAAGGARTEAMDEFNKWLTGQLTRGISGVTDINTFASTLLAFPKEPELIADAIYANSKTMDGRHFAQEFIRRRKLAEKGVVEKQPANSPSADTQSNNGGGWNEVAKKSSHKDPAVAEASTIQGAGFKVVPGRKKGKK